MFEVVDQYEGCALVGRAETLHEACELARQRVEDTDGECYVEIFDPNGEPVEW